MSRILFQDIDGCLNITQSGKPKTIDVKGKSFTTRELAAWKNMHKQCRSSQTELVIVTGRTIEQIGPLIKHLGATWVIAEHGAVLYDPKTENSQTLIEVLSNQSQRKQELKVLQNTHEQIRKIRQFLVQHQSEIEKQLLQIKEYNGEPLYYPKTRLNCSIIYPEVIRIAGKQKAFAEIVQSLIPEIHPSIRISIGLYGLDFLTSITKKDGIEALACELKIDMDKSAYIGDEEGDIAPMSVVNMPCCPANAMPKVKTYVKQKKGIIAKESYLKGTLEILRKI